MMTREEAIDALVERDVAKWGERERDAARRLRSQLSHGRALNALAHYGGRVDAGLAKAAEAVLTTADWRELRGL